MNLLTPGLLILASFQFFTPIARSAESVGLSQRQLNGLASHPPSVEQTTLALAVMGVATDSLRKIKADLETITSTKPPGKLTIVNDRLLENGVETGLRIVSTTPLNLEYRGRPWQYDSTRGIEYNFSSLTALFLTQPRSTASFIPHLLPVAHAQTVTRDQVGAAAFIGAVAMIVGAGVFGAACGATAGVGCGLALAISLVYGGVGSAIGYYGGSKIGHQKKEQATQRLNAFLNLENAVKCTTNALTIGPVPGSPARLSIDRVTKEINFLGFDGKPVEYLGGTMKKRLGELAKSCEDPDSLKDLNRRFASGVTVARQVIVGAGGEAGAPRSADAPAASSR